MHSATTLQLGLSPRINPSIEFFLLRKNGSGNETPQEPHELKPKPHADKKADGIQNLAQVRPSLGDKSSQWPQDRYRQTRMHALKYDAFTLDAATNATFSPGSSINQLLPKPTMIFESPAACEKTFTKLVAAFYRRVRTDDLIGPMYPQDDFDGSEQRLRDFLIYRFGGSDRYIQERGHPRMKMRHMPFKIGIKERDRWLELMGAAMEETEVPGEIVLELKVFFEQVADFMRNVDG